LKTLIVLLDSITEFIIGGDRFKQTYFTAQRFHLLFQVHRFPSLPFFCLTGLTDQPVYLSASSKAPTYSEVFESLSEFGIFQIREKEELRRAVFCSEKSDVTGNRTKGVRGKILIILFHFLIRKIRLLQI